MKGAGSSGPDERVIPTVGRVYARADAVAMRFPALRFGRPAAWRALRSRAKGHRSLHGTVEVRVQWHEARRVAGRREGRTGPGGVWHKKWEEHAVDRGW